MIISSVNFKNRCNGTLPKIGTIFKLTVFGKTLKITTNIAYVDHICIIRWNAPTKWISKIYKLTSIIQFIKFSFQTELKNTYLHNFSAKSFRASETGNLKFVRPYENWQDYLSWLVKLKTIWEWHAYTFNEFCFTKQISVENQIVEHFSKYQ